MNERPEHISHRLACFARGVPIGCQYGIGCIFDASHYVERYGGSRRSGYVCPRHAQASAARFPGEPKPKRIPPDLLVPHDARVTVDSGPLFGGAR